MAQVKTKRMWHPSRLEQHVSEIGRRAAEREAARIPWQRLYVSREKYVEWEAFALWVRAVEHAEGDLPAWLAKIVDKRCLGFLKFSAEGKSDHPKDVPFFWYHLERWINDRIFAVPWREAWVNAVGYFAARDLRSLRNHAYWEYCERAWRRSKPAVYPSFPEWLKASEHCSDQVLDEYEMLEEKHQLIKLMRRVGPRAIHLAVECYLEWEVFAYWARTALEAQPPLPPSVRRELRQKCQYDLETHIISRALNPTEVLHCRFNRLLEWIEEHEFARPKKEGWLDVLRYQARLHPRHARVIDYWHDWEAQWAKHPSPQYPSLKKWRDAADRYTFGPVDAR